VAGVDLIAVAELADELGMYRATIFKIVRRLGIQPVKRRDSEQRRSADCSRDRRGSVGQAGSCRNLNGPLLQGRPTSTAAGNTLCR